MKKNWHAIADKIDAMSLRERAMIFGSAVIAVVALLSTLLVDPLIKRQKELSAQIDQYQHQIDATQGQYKIIMQAALKDPDAQNKKQLEAIQSQIAQSDVELSKVQKRLVPPERMVTLLEDILTRNKRLQLASLNSLPVSSVGETAGAPLFYRHGVELTVTGSYFDLMEYLRELEKLTPQMLWGKVSLVVVNYPDSALTLTFYTLSTEKSWLKV